MRKATEVRYIKLSGNDRVIPYGWRVYAFAGSGDYLALIRTVSKSSN